MYYDLCRGVILSVDGVLMTLVAVYLVFVVTGRNYDSAVIASGFCGLGMGATPVAIANIPLIGVFFINLLNAIVIKVFLAMPFFVAG